jgi:hypothetical protein
MLSSSLKVLNGPFIQPGESLSDGVDCTAGEIVRLTMPGAWTPANISFQISSNGEFYNDLFGMDGKEIIMDIEPASAVVLKGRDWAKAYAFVKIRSGTRGFPVAQKELREFAIALEVPDKAAVIPA